PEERSLLPAEVPVTLVFNKIDLSAGLPMQDTLTGPPRVHVSAATGACLDLLRSHLKGCVSFQSPGNGSISARRRHIEALARARECVETAVGELEQRGAGELVAEELRHAQRALEEITGSFTADDLLGRIFGSFCIGKLKVLGNRCFPPKDVQLAREAVFGEPVGQVKVIQYSIY